jgi:hypothetical protein
MKKVTPVMAIKFNVAEVAAELVHPAPFPLLQVAQ